MTHEWIDDARALDAVADAVRGAPWVALDTEFMREQTYYAKLCLIQLATPTFVALVDPLKIDIAPLLDALYSPTVINVLHSARQDLELFFDIRAALPARVFDTQIAAALLGFDEQIGYGNLVTAITGIELDKTQTRTNWAVRPLNAEQLRYADADVRHLRDVYLELCTRLDARGRLAWAEEECARLTQAALYANALDTIHLRIKHGHVFSPAAQGALRALMIWREQTARARNLPRGWVVRDEDLIAIAHARPQTRAALEQVPKLSAAALKYAEAILATLRTLDNDRGAVWPARVQLDTAQQKRLTALTEFVRTRARELEIGASLLATRKDLERLVLGQHDVLVLQGWRRDVIGGDLLARLGN